MYTWICFILNSLNTGREDWEKEILSKVQGILEFAIEYVNFSEELLMLDSAIQSEDIPKIIEAFKAVKNMAEDQLQADGYPEFRAHILNKYGYINDKDKEDVI